MAVFKLCLYLLIQRSCVWQWCNKSLFDSISPQCSSHSYYNNQLIHHEWSPDTCLWWNISTELMQGSRGRQESPELAATMLEQLQYLLFQTLLQILKHAYFSFELISQLDWILSECFNMASESNISNITFILFVFIHQVSVSRIIVIISIVVRELELEPWSVLHGPPESEILILFTFDYSQPCLANELNLLFS